MHCIYCGANNHDEAVFCQKCGKQLMKSGQAEQSQVDPTQYAAPPSQPYGSFPYTDYGASEPGTPPPPPLDTPYGGLLNPYEQKPPLFTPTPRQKNRRKLWIILSIISALVLIAVAGLIYYSVSTSSTPQKTLDTICNALLRDDYQTAYNQFSSSHPFRQLTEQQYAAEVQYSNQTRGGLSNCVVSDVSQTGSSATGIATQSFGNGTSLRTLLTLTDENGVWKISKSAGL